MVELQLCVNISYEALYLVFAVICPLVSSLLLQMSRGTSSFSRVTTSVIYPPSKAMVHALLEASASEAYQNAFYAIHNPMATEADYVVIGRAIVSMTQEQDVEGRPPAFYAQIARETFHGLQRVFVRWFGQWRKRKEGFLGELEGCLDQDTTVEWLSIVDPALIFRYCCAIVCPPHTQLLISVTHRHGVFYILCCRRSEQIPTCEGQHWLSPSFHAAAGPECSLPYAVPKYTAIYPVTTAACRGTRALCCQTHSNHTPILSSLIAQLLAS
ncbi:hypothetical protein V8D89_015842 [Ganoderma adspersum]